MRFSADLHPGTKSRPLYRTPAPDPSATRHLIVSQAPVPLPRSFDGHVVVFRTGADLAAELSVAVTGLRLYVFGGEAFVWDMFRVALQSGLDADEIFLHPDVGRRRVQCIHCKTVAEEVAAPELDCPGCGLRLLVRDHFSRRLAAFQGVAMRGATRGEATR